MDDAKGYPVVRYVFILLLAAIVVGDVALFLRMSADIVGH